MVEGHIRRRCVTADQQSATIELERGGSFTIALRPDKAAKTVANFVAKAKSGFYDGKTFHRVEDWVVQGGDPEGTGRGGRNVELALALALALRGAKDIHAIACDTDGVDGSEEVAGALIGPDTLRRGGQLGVDAAAALANNDGHSFFATLGNQVVTGPTLTNVNDFRAVLVT